MTHRWIPDRVGNDGGDFGMASGRYRIV
jgi:hypothetical protein